MLVSAPPNVTLTAPPAPALPPATGGCPTTGGWSPWQIWGTILSVFITTVILVLKVFDIVYVLTNGRDKTNVIANLFFNEMFANSDSGKASAIVVILLALIIPVLIYQVKMFREQEANR